MVSPALISPARRALVVDDDRRVLRAFAVALTVAGFDVRTAATGTQALEVAGQHEPEVILLDRRLPDLCGQEVLGQLRAAPGTATAVIVMISGDDQLEPQLHSFDRGADDCLTKPVDLRELLARVDGQLAAHDRWQGRLDEVMAARLQLAGQLVDLDASQPLATTVHALGALLSSLLGADEVAVSPSAGISLAPAIAGAGRGIAPTAGAAAAIHDPQLERVPEGGIVHVPLRAAAGTFAVLSVATRAEPEPVLSALLDLTPHLSTLLRPGVEASMTTDRERFRLEQLLRPNGMRPVFQPIVSLADGGVVGFEGLTRFADGAAPERVFELAARAGMGDVFQLEAARRILAGGRTLPARAWLSINVSAPMLLHADLGPVLAPTSRPLRLEITEHELVEDYAAVRAAIDQLPGVSLSVDDAGSGYASMRHVYELRPAMVKLDRTWVADIDRDPVRQALIRGLLGFTDQIGATVVGEGIERDAERTTLQRLGVALGQGFLFARPAPAATFGGSS